MSAPSRRLVVFTGSPGQTSASAGDFLKRLPIDDVLWIGDGPGQTAQGAVKRLLGQSFRAVVLDCHAGVPASVLGQAQGLA